MAEEALLVLVLAVMVPSSAFWAAPALGVDTVACPSSATVFKRTEFKVLSWVSRCCVLVE